MRPAGEAFAREAAKLPALSVPYRNGGDTLKGMDCQGLVEYCLRQLGVRKNWRGSNAMWRDMVWRGTPEDCRKAFGRIPKGAFLYIVAFDGGEKARGYADDLGNAGHVGVYTGTGLGAVHASSSRGMTAESRFSGKTIPNGGWNRVGLCGLLDYGLSLAGKTEGSVGKMAMTVWSENGGRVRLRARPSLSAACVDRLEPGTEVEVLEDGEEWAKIASGGKTGYMKRMYLRETGDSESLEARIRNLEMRVKKLEEA